MTTLTTPNHARPVNELLESLHISRATRSMLNVHSIVDYRDHIEFRSMVSGRVDHFMVRLYDPEERSRFAGGLSASWARNTPGSKELTKHPAGHGNWYALQCTDFSVLRTLNSWDADKIEFADDYARSKYNDVLMRFVVGEVNAKRVYDFKELNKAPEAKFLVRPEDDRKLNLYQSVGVTNSLATPGFALFMEQGTGKTPIVITRICHDAIKKVAEGRGYYRGVVVAPANVLHNWANEFKRFATTNIDAVPVEGTPQQRLSIIRRLFVDGKPGHLGGIAVMSYRTAIGVGAVLKLLGANLDIAIVDESHTIKNPNTKVTKGLFTIRDLSEARMVLTGTPIGNTPLDLWAQLEFLYEGCSGFTDYPSFKKYFAKHIVTGETGLERLAELANVPLLQEKLARNAFVIRKIEALPHLPSKNYDTLTVDMGKTQKAMYDKLADELALSIAAEVEKAEHNPSIRSIVINNALTKALKLTQITSGFCKWDEVVDEATGDVLQASYIEPTPENAKLDLLLEQLAAMDKHSKAIIWNVQIWPLNMLYKKLTELGYNPVRYYGSTSSKDREAAVAAFNDEHLRGTKYTTFTPAKDMCRVFLGQTKAAGPGLNLLGYPPGDPDSSPMNADRVFRYSRDYSFLNESQSDDRSHRIGTRVPIQLTSLLCNRSIDMTIHSRMQEKRDVALDIQDLRDILIDMAGGL